MTCIPILLNAQKDVTTFGIQIKPIIPISFFVDGPNEYTDSIYSGTFSSKTGYSFGMVVRHGFTKTISLETGINYVRRNYDATMAKQTDTALLSDQLEFGFVSYSIPVKGLIFVRLSEQLYMNAAAGVDLNAYASPIFKLSENRQFQQYAFPRKRFGASVLANLGFEFRTKESGSFYLGASYSRPFGNMASTRSIWQNEITQNHTTINELAGQYLTLDLRYFFHEEATKKKRKSSSDDK